MCLFQFAGLKGELTFQFRTLGGCVLAEPFQFDGQGFRGASLGGQFIGQVLPLAVDFFQTALGLGQRGEGCLPFLLCPVGELAGRFEAGGKLADRGVGPGFRFPACGSLGL